MSNSFENLFNHVHGAVTRFPIALLFVGVGMDYFAGEKPGLRSGAWLVLGTLGTIVATITGLVAHLDYEDDSVRLSAIDRHQYLGFATTALFVGLTAWRWRSWGLVCSGFLGGSLLLERGIRVKGVTR